MGGMTEIWREIPDTCGKYEVSNLGTVRSRARGNRWRELRPFQDTCGYLYVDIHRRSRAVHRLVAEAFLPEIEGKPEINHKDGFKHNNRADNLERCNRSENVKHAFDIGLKHSASRGDSVKARRVVCLDTGVVYECIEDAAEASGAHAPNISKCCKGIRNKAAGYRWRYADGGDVHVS